MTTNQVKLRIEKLKTLIEQYRHAYHVLDKSLVSDAVNDSLKHELQDLEEKYPQFKTPDSPTQRIGGEPLEKFIKVVHDYPMLSLRDIFSFEELRQWEERSLKICSKIIGGYFAELKIDGLAVSLIYENGVFVRGATRGDGKVGEDVTANLKTIEAVPLNIKMTNKNAKMPEKIEVRGEVYMPIEVFEELNKKYQQENKPLLANPRNAAAGSIRQLDPKIARSRQLSFVAWDLLGIKTKTHAELHEMLASFGFKTVKETKLASNLDEVEEFKAKVEKLRANLTYQIDGIVVLVNDNETRQKLGIVGKAPRGMVAYKFAPEEATTCIEDIQVQIGRTGILTPVAILKPVAIAGSVVSRATLHNEDEIRKKDIRIGDTVIVHKAGDIIPEVEKVIKELRTGKEKIFYFPKNCPQCKGKVIREEGKAAYRCSNKNCFVVECRALEHFVSRSAFDMAGLGPKIITKLIDEGLVKDAADLFKLKKGDLELLERFAEKSAQNIIDTIQNHHEIDLPRFIYALGIPNVGEQTSYDMAQYINQKSKISDATVGVRHSPTGESSDKTQNSKLLLKFLKITKLEEWQKIPDIGPIVAKSIYDYFQNPKNQEFIERLLKSGVKIKFASISDKKLDGLTFVFSGGLEKLTRDQAKQKVRILGGDVSESVSQATSYLVAGSDPGEKYDKAKECGVKIIPENEFLKMVA